MKNKKIKYYTRRKNGPRKIYLVGNFQKGSFKDSTNPADPKPEHRDVPDEDCKEKDGQLRLRLFQIQ